MSNYFVRFSDLNISQVRQYRDIVTNAFPLIVRKSPVIAKYWTRVEEYFTDFQLFLLNDEGDVIGLINSIPFHWDGDLQNLPRQGWDWMLRKGVRDYESSTVPNSLGGLQIIVEQNHLGQGISKVIINKAKQIVADQDFNNFVIPIRPTYKNRHPHMPMSEYIDYRVDGKIFDPWIRTHLKDGAKIINVCDRAMHIYGDLNFWNDIMNEKVSETGDYIIEGALNPVHIDVEGNYGEYYEDNIWINYPR